MLHATIPTRKTIQYPTRASLVTRNPSFTWRVNDGAHRATVAASVSLVSDTLKQLEALGIPKMKLSEYIQRLIDVDFNGRAKPETPTPKGKKATVKA